MTHKPQPGPGPDRRTVTLLLASTALLPVLPAPATPGRAALVDGWVLAPGDLAPAAE